MTEQERARRWLADNKVVVKYDDALVQLLADFARSERAAGMEEAAKIADAQYDELHAMRQSCDSTELRMRYECAGKFVNDVAGRIRELNRGEGNDANQIR